MRLRFGIVFLLAPVAVGALRLLGCGGPEFVTGGADGAPPPDAGPGDAVGPALPFCSTIDADFCSDFDQAPLPENWTKFAVAGGASGVEDDDASVSPPNSFLSTVPTFPVDAGTVVAGSAILTRLSLPKGQSHIAFAMRIDEISFPDPSDDTATIVTAAYTQGTDYAVALEFHPSLLGAPFAAALLELTTSVGGTTTSKLDPLDSVLTDLGTWYEVTIDFGIDTSDAGLVPASVSVTPAGGTTTTKVLNLTVPLDAIGGARTLSVGVQATPPTGEAKIRFDNVTYNH